MTDPTLPLRPPAAPPPTPVAPQQHPLTRRHRGLYWAAVLASVAALVAGVVVTVSAYLGVSAPESTATAYFHALARGDAAAALALGTVPAGSRAFLTSDVLSAAQKLAKISDVRVLSARKLDSRTEQVALQYQLGYATAPVAVTDQVKVVRHGRGWRLAASAVQVRVVAPVAGARMSIAGANLPSGEALFFPGALPVSVDTSNLTLDMQVVHLVGPYRLSFTPRLTEAGRQRVSSAVAAAVQPCLGGNAPDSCPRPADPRTVPGSVRGTVSSSGVAAHLTIAVGAGAAGVLEISGTVDVTGTHRQLDFDNMPQARSGTSRLTIDAYCYATDPSRIAWGSTS